jgi:hypothetical protein
VAAIDFSDADEHDRLQREPLNIEINAAIDRVAAVSSRAPRGYLGASSAGHECLRRIQFDWMCAPITGAQTTRIFDRGHAAEAIMRAQLQKAGYEFAPPEACEFVAFERFAGHADGIVIAGPRLLDVYFAFPAVWECKCVSQKNFRAIVRDGLAMAFPHYATQVALYQRFLGKTNPALYTIVDANTCETAHFAVPYDAGRAETAIANIERVIEATKTGHLLPPAYRSSDDWRCIRSCAHRGRCRANP